MGLSIQPSSPKITPIRIQQQSGHQKEYIALQVIPRAEPHMELPQYQHIKEEPQQKPESRNQIKELSVKA